MNEIVEKENIENLIYEIRGKQVMLDSDLARLFGYETKYLNRQVKRNIERFPHSYYFRLTKEEYKQILRRQNGTLELEQGKSSKYLSYVFTEYGITMLAGILKSKIAIKASLKIVDTFIAMKHYISANLVEQKYINNLVLEDHEKIKTLETTLKKIDEKKKDYLQIET